MREHSFCRTMSPCQGCRRTHGSQGRGRGREGRLPHDGGSCTRKRRRSRASPGAKISLRSPHAQRLAHGLRLARGCWERRRIRWSVEHRHVAFARPPPSPPSPPPPGVARRSLRWGYRWGGRRCSGGEVRLRFLGRELRILLRRVSVLQQPARLGLGSPLPPTPPLPPPGRSLRSRTLFLRLSPWPTLCPTCSRDCP